MDAVKTGAFLAALRRSKDMTQQEAAEKLGVSNKTVSKWESGGGYPDITVLPALAALYGVTADELLAGERGEAAGEPGGAVEAYLAHRGTLRFRLGASGALLCTLAAYYFRAKPWVGVLLLGSALAIWLGWSAPADQRDRERRFWFLLALAVAQVWILTWRVNVNYGLLLRLTPPDARPIGSFLCLRLSQTLFLLLLPPAYALLRLWLRRQAGRTACLLPRPVFWASLGGWAAALGVNAARWARELPGILEYVRVNPVWKKRLLRELLAGSVDPVAQAVSWLWLAAVVLAILWTMLGARKKAVAETWEQW